MKKNIKLAEKRKAYAFSKDNQPENKRYKKGTTFATVAKDFLDLPVPIKMIPKNILSIVKEYGNPEFLSAKQILAIKMIYDSLRGNDKMLRLLLEQAFPNIKKDLEENEKPVKAIVVLPEKEINSNE